MCLILADVLKYADNKVLERMSINYQIMEYSIDVVGGLFLLFAETAFCLSICPVCAFVPKGKTSRGLRFSHRKLYFVVLTVAGSMR